MRNQIGAGNADTLKNFFDTGSVTDITNAINNNWLKPRSYIDREINPEAHENNLRDRQTRAERVIRELPIFDSEKGKK